MFLAKVIINISILFWLLPPFRQLKGGYFLYFLILGYSDPLALLLGWLFNINANYTHLVIAFLLVLSVLYYVKYLNYYWFIGLTFIVIFSLLTGERNIRYLSIIALHLLILISILLPAIKGFYQTQRINTYFSVLLLYELTIILKLIAFVLNYFTGVYLFYISLAFELLICVYFIFYNLDNSPLIRLPFSKEHEYQ